MTPFYSDPADAPWALLARHLAAEATAAERASLREWVQAAPAHLQILTAVTRAWERAGEAVPNRPLFSAADVEAAWQRFQPLMATPVGPRVPEEVPPAGIGPVVRPLWPAAAGWFTPLVRVAAGLALVLGAGYLLLARWAAKPAPESAAAGSFAASGTRRLVRLPDGSRVWLNARSRLHYAGFGQGPGPGVRAVQLTGEAYFDVTHNAARAFVVSTASTRVRVTGTAFNVRAYAAEDSVEVSVSRGRVWVVRLAVPDSVLLAAGTRAALLATDAPGRVAGPLRTGPAADANFRAWQTDTLRFQDASVARVARTLRATFGTRVAVDGAGLDRCRFTGTFAHPQPAQVLAVLAVVTASRLSPDGHGGYWLRGTGCQPAPPDTSAADTTAVAPAP